MASTGLKRAGGGVIGGWDHVVQSLSDIFTTPIGSRVMRRDYGSDLPRIVDAPMTQRTLLRLYNAVATAAARWEPRIRITRVAYIDAGADGHATLALINPIYYPRGHLGDFTNSEVMPNVQVVLR